MSKDYLGLLRSTAQENENFNGVPVFKPKLDLDSVLYSYQKDGVDFVNDKRRCIIGDEMGLGKTLMALKSISDNDPENKSHWLIATPKSAKAVWVKEIKKWLGEDCEVVSSTDGVITVGAKFLNPQKRFTICNVEQFRQFYNYIVAFPYNGIVIDEAHKLRNIKTKMRIGAGKICHHFMLVPLYLITGTALVNSPRDLYSLLNLIDPYQFSNEERFLNAWFYVYRYGQGYQYRHKNVDAFQKFISQFMIRRLRKDAIDLPPVRNIDIPIYLEGEQLRFYNSMRDLWYAEIMGDGNRSSVEVTCLLAQITRLKQLCLAQNMIFGADDCDGAKLETLLDMLEDIKGSKCVIFSQFSKYLRALKVRLEAEGYRVGIITGDVSEKNRAEQVDMFQERDELDIMLLTTKSGGESITLTEASYVFFMDLEWTPAANDQAFSRVYRIGQTEKVTKYYLRAEKTIEQYIEDVIGRKRQLFGQSVPTMTIRKLFYGDE